MQTIDAERISSSLPFAAKEIKVSKCKKSPNGNKGISILKEKQNINSPRNSNILGIYIVTTCINVHQPPPRHSHSIEKKYKTNYESTNNDMSAQSGAAATENMNNFVPSSDLIQEPECDTLLIYLPGFKKEQLRVQLTRSGFLRISGARPLGDNRWSSFQKEFPVPPNCHSDKITAKFEGGILYIRQPKLTVPAGDKATKIPPPEITPKPQQEKEKAEATPSDDEYEQASDDKYEEPEAKAEEKFRESEDAKKDERKREKVPGIKGPRRDAVPSEVGGDYMLKLDKLKMARRMTMVVAVVIAFALGLYISKYMAWFGKKAES